MPETRVNNKFTEIPPSPENPDGFDGNGETGTIRKQTCQTMSAGSEFLIRYYMFFLLFALLFSACQGNVGRSRTDDTGIRLVNGKPFWFFNPDKDGKAGGVGVSGRHVSGRNAQRELAIHRAINDLARQMNVEVNSVVSSSSTSSGSGSRSELSSYSIQTVNGQVVKARIIEFWEDRETDELYVWMVLQ